MRTPRFWRTRSLFSTLLLPFAFIYDVVSSIHRELTTPTTLPIPVICVGNLTAGGAGKTPTALMIGKKLRERGITAFFLSRGYGGSEKGPLLVDPKFHTHHEVGDEALLLAEILPTVVAKDRASGGRFCVAKGADVIIMDDGFQNPSLSKTLSLVVIDDAYGIGNGRLIPAGPLREWPYSGFARAQVIVLVNPERPFPTSQAGKPLLPARTQPRSDAKALKDQKLIAFCGIAHPEKFFDMLQALGADVKEEIIFPDHHPFTAVELKELVQRALAQGAGLVTTAKDAVRLPPSLQGRVNILAIDLVLDNVPLLDMLIDEALNPT